MADSLQNPMTSKTAGSSSELCVRIRNEIRCCIATKIMSIIFQLGMMPVRKINDKMNELFHGNHTVISHVDMAIKSIGPYEKLFEKRVEIVLDADTNPSNLIANRSLFLLDKDYIVGRHVTKMSLENKTLNASAGLVRGRSLHRLAKTSMANMKKAYAFLLLMPEVDELTSEGVTFKSGITEEEVKLKLLDKMYTELNGKEDGVNVDGVNVDDDECGDQLPDSLPNTEETSTFKTRPHGWFFTGWFAFCLYGPFTSEHERISIFEKGGSSQDQLKTNGRAVKRELEKKEDEMTRNNDNNNQRGMSFSIKLGVDNLEHKKNELAHQQKETSLIALNMAIQQNQRNLDRSEKRAERLCPEYDPDNIFWKKVNQLEVKSMLLEAQLDNFHSPATEGEASSELLNKYVVYDNETPKRSRKQSSDTYDLTNTGTGTSSSSIS
jgi:hypothetical protein